MSIDLNDPNWFRGLPQRDQYVKHPGNKNKPHYNALGRYYAQQAGTTGLDDPASGPGGFLAGIRPTGQVRMNEWDMGLHNLTGHVKAGDFIVPFDEGPMDVERWMDEIRGATIQRIQRGELPKEGSLNHVLHQMNEGLDFEEMSPEMQAAFARIYYKNKKTGRQGGIRPSRVGGYNNNTAGWLVPFNRGDVDDLSRFAPLFANTELRQGDATEALREWDIDRKNLLASDPPYENEPSTYSGHFNLQNYLRELQERLEEGQPILAFDSADVAPLYADIGLEPQIMTRRDMTSNKPEFRGDKPEMVAAANMGVDALNPLEVLSRFGHDRFVPVTEDLFSFMRSEQNAFEHGWAVLKQGGI